MKLYVLIPLAVTVASLLAIWFVNRRAVCHSALWPKGLSLSGSVDRPDVSYDGELFLACAGGFGTIRCRTLRVARGADVEANTVEAETVLVEGRLRGVASLAAARHVAVRGELFADDVRTPRVRLFAGASAVVLTVPRDARIDRHPGAQVKGFFADLDEAMAVDYVRRLKQAEAPFPGLPS